MMANAAAALIASFKQLNHEIFCGQRYFATIKLLPQKLGLHASVLQQYQLAPTYAKQYALVVSTMRAAAARNEQCA